MRIKHWFYFTGILIAGIWGCESKPKAASTPGTIIYKGLYSFGPEEKSFKDCAQARMFWAVDSSAQLELQYSQLGFEKPYVPVYIEVEGKKIKSAAGDVSAVFDSTLVVTKVLKITKEIPPSCN
jgi:copper homeostasis protein (lipoprotein)